MNHVSKFLIIRSGWPRGISTVTGLLWLWLGCAPLPAQSNPHPGAARIHENWDAGWLFARQSKGVGELGSFDRTTGTAALVEPRFLHATDPGYDDSEWLPIALPHTWNDQDVMDQKPGYWRGIGWYRKHFRLDPSSRSKRIFVEFEAVGQVGEFWLNGRELGVHKGGYTGFEFDITDFVRFDGADNVITAKVDNLFRSTLPPTVKTDYNFYGGIYRDAWLRVSSPVYLSDVHWLTPGVTESSSDLTIQTEVTNRTPRRIPVEITHEILDPGGKVVQKISAALTLPAESAAAGITQKTVIDHPELWAPQTPRVYAIRTSIREGSTLLDRTEIPLGFRRYRFDPQAGFFLNGKRLEIQGADWHQSYPGMGNALPKSRHVKDMEILRDMGANCWRTSHYPHNIATIEASDRLGLMVWEELPVNKEIGDPKEYMANVSNMAREMIARDRNHPSIILWGIAGEINAAQKVSFDVVAGTVKRYRELDPSRPVAMHAPRGDDVEGLVDVVGLDADAGTDAKHRRYPNRNYMAGEFAVGTATSGRGIYGDQPESDDDHALLHEQHWAEFLKRPWMAGGLIWDLFDYDGETYDRVTPHVAAVGLCDIWRIPKESYYFYQSQWSSRPMVHLVSHWTWPGQEGRPRQVKVYSNAAVVELFLNGRSLGKQGRPAGAVLTHPARVWETPYEPGTLRAVAHVADREVIDERKTAGAPYQIVLTADTGRLTSGDAESLAYITGVVEDRAGVVVPDACNPISFTLYGPGELLQQTWPPYGTGLTWNAVAGMTRIALRSTPRSGWAVVSASSPGLKMGRLKIDVTAPGKPDEMNYKERFEVDELQ